MIEKIPGHRYTRVTCPSAPYGNVEMIFRRSVDQVGYRPGKPEVEVSDYDNNWSAQLSEDVYRREADEAITYSVRQWTNYARSDVAWAVMASDGAVAACPMNGASKYFGSREEAERWAAHLNDLFA